MGTLTYSTVREEKIESELTFMHKGMQPHHRIRDLPSTAPRGNLISSSTGKCATAQKGSGRTSGPSPPSTWQVFHCWVYSIDLWSTRWTCSHPLGQRPEALSSRFSLLLRTLYFLTIFMKTFPSNSFFLQNIRKLKLHFSLYQYQHLSNSPTTKPFSMWVSMLTIMEGLDITFLRYMSHH